MENFDTDQSPILERGAAVEGGAEEAPAGTLQIFTTALSRRPYAE